MIPVISPFENFWYDLRVKVNTSIKRNFDAESALTVLAFVVELELLFLRLGSMS
jgi:hypothetical protein